MTQDSSSWRDTLGISFFVGALALGGYFNHQALERTGVDPHAGYAGTAVSGPVINHDNKHAFNHNSSADNVHEKIDDALEDGHDVDVEISIDGNTPQKFHIPGLGLRS